MRLRSPDFTAEELTIRLHLNRSRGTIEAMTKAVRVPAVALQLADLHKDVSAASDALNTIRSMRMRGIAPTRIDELAPTGCQCSICVENRRVGR